MGLYTTSGITMSLKITVVDEQTGETMERRIGEGDYAVITAHPCEVKDFAKDDDLVVIRIKNHAPLPLPELKKNVS